MKFINDACQTLYILPATILLYVIIVENIKLYQNDQIRKRVRSVVLYLTCSLLLFCACEFSLEFILKISLGRPRPRETIGLSKSDNECLVEYTGFLQRFNYSNPCNTSFYSCPSGHALETTLIVLLAIFEIHYHQRYC